MKKYKSIGKLLAVSFLTAAIASACTEDAMDKINENPNNPLDAPAKFLITDLGVSTAFSTVGGDFSLYSSVYIEHETGISNQLYRAEVRSGEPTTATTYNNAWINVYSNIKNAKIVIKKCEEDPSEKGNVVTEAIAKSCSLTTEQWQPMYLEIHRTARLVSSIRTAHQCICSPK